MLDQKALGNQVYKARTGLGLTHEQMAEMCAITPGYLRQIEQGIRLPSLPLFVTICEKLQVSPIFLLRGSLLMKQPDAYARFVETLLGATPRQAEMIVSIIEAAKEHLPEEKE